MPAAGSIHNNMLAESQIGDGGRVEVVNFTNFGETYTDNVRIHTRNYTSPGRLPKWGNINLSLISCMCDPFM